VGAGTVREVGGMPPKSDTACDELAGMLSAVACLEEQSRNQAARESTDFCHYVVVPLCL
jgi:hypothetical protein